LLKDAADRVAKADKVASVVKALANKAQAPAKAVAACRRRVDKHEYLYRTPTEKQTGRVRFF